MPFGDVHAGQRECFDHDLMIQAATGYSCAESHAEVLSNGQDCSILVQELPVRDGPWPGPFRPNGFVGDYPALPLSDWCPATCSNCGQTPTFLAFAPESGTYSATARPLDPASRDSVRNVRTGQNTFTYDYNWVVPTGFDSSMLIKDACPVSCQNCRGA